MKATFVRNMMIRFAAVLTVAGAALTALQAADDLDAAPQQQQGGRGRGRGGGPPIYKAQVSPHWFANNTRFWYRNDFKDGAKEFILVDAEKGVRQVAFDHQKLAEALSKASDQKFTADKLPFAEIEFIEDGKAIQFKAAEKSWKCDMKSYECVPLANNAAALNTERLASALSSLERRARSDAPHLVQDGDASLNADDQASFADDDVALAPQQATQTQAQGRGRGRGAGRGQGQGSGFGGRGFNQEPRISPDAKWSASITNFNVFVRSLPDGPEYRLTEDGVTNNAYGRLEWSPDSKTLVAWRSEPGDYNPAYLVESSPQGGGLAQLRERHYEQPGNKLTTYELSLFDIETRKQTKPEVERVDFGSPTLRWKEGGARFTYEKIDRGHQRLRVIEINAQSGAARNIVDEKTETFIWTAHPESYTQRGLRPITYLDKSDEIIHASEQDGWRHLYLIDAKEGKLKNQITKGEWVVRGIDLIDEEKRQIWFQASGMNRNQDPYFIHYYRINFDGTGLVALTEDDGSHTVTFSPDRKYVIDTYSRVDMPPVNELRQTADGKLVCKLEEADITDLKASGWKPPEVFVAKGRDGKTDIWGIICRPRDYDPQKKYPILEDIYAGPHDSFAPKSFSSASRYETYNRLGFVVVKLDGMGTANRSKAFHDVCWKNIKDAGFPDRILWIKAAAEKYPSMDTTRVGIYGTSAGGQNAAAAVLFHPEFYKAAMANCGCHDNRIDKRSWNEQWMGYMPKDKIYNNDPDNWYSQSSNIDNAAKLKVHLMLVVGELDTNVPPESTFRFADALIRAGKDFEYIVVPGEEHGIRLNPQKSAYVQRRTQEFFAKHLLGIEPANQNTETGAAVRP